MKQCKICGDKVHGKGLCKKHWTKEYNKRPEVKKRRRECERKRRQHPDVKAKNLEYMRERRKHTEFKAKEHEYNKLPEVMARKRKNARKRYLCPEVRAKELERNKEYRQKNKDELKNWRKKHDQHPDVRNRIREYQRKYVQRPYVRAKILEYYRRSEVKAMKGEYHRKYCQLPEHKERHRECSKKYRQNPENRIILLKQHRKKRAKKNNIIEKFSQKRWMEKLKDTNGICPRCSTRVGIEKMTMDHNPTISKAPVGFIYTINDVSPMCGSCNTSKYNRIEQPITIKLTNYI